MQEMSEEETQEKIRLLNSPENSAKLIKEVDGEITIEAENEESYLKVFTPFRGVAKLYVFENECWVDAETSQPFSGFDLTALGLDQLGDLEKDEATEPPKIIT